MDYIEKRDNHSNTLLHLAVNNNNYEEVKNLVQKGANINAKNEDGLTPFELASSRNRSGIVAFFVKYKDNTGNTLLHYAAEEGNLELVNLLLEKGAEVDDKNNYDYTPLHFAALNGNLSVVKKLVEKGANVNAEDLDRLTPLELAKTKKKLDVVRFFVDYKDKYNYTLLHYAAMNNNLSVVDLLLKEEADVNTQNEEGSTPLHWAVLNGNSSVVEKLIEKKANIDAKNKEGSTPLHEAARNGHLSIVEKLMEKKANINAKDKEGYTSLHFAAIKGHLSVVEKLIEKGAKVNAQNKEDSTPLHEAARNGHLDVVEKLIEKKADVDAKNKKDSTPLHLAAANSYLRVAKELIDNNANVDKKNSDGNTPLHLAAYRGLFYVVKELIDRGANVNAENLDRLTPLELARENNKTEIVDFLEQEKRRRSEDSTQPRIRHKRHKQHHREQLQEGERPTHLKSNGAGHSIGNVNSAIESNQAASGASRSSPWINAIVDAVKGASRFIFSPFKPAIGMEHSQPYGVDVVKSLTKKGTDFNSPKGSTESPALLTSRERDNITATGVPKISADVVNDALTLGNFAIRLFNKTQYRQPTPDNLLSPLERLMRSDKGDIIRETILHSEHNKSKVKSAEEQQGNLENKKPKSYLNNTSVQGHLTQVRDLRLK